VNCGYFSRKVRACVKWGQRGEVGLLFHSQVVVGEGGLVSGILQLGQK
jgi:hypothetical protein